MYADLHIHSTFSDSSHTPEDIARILKKNNIGIASICDHYSVQAYERFRQACKEYKIICIPGVELDANLEGINYHMLAYNFDLENETFLSFVAKQHAKNQKECEDIIERMSKDYPQISVEEYRDYEAPLDRGGWKYLYYAVEKGIYQTYEQANRCIFPQYFKPREETFTVSVFCEAVKAGGGVPVLAHPGASYKGEDFPKFIQKMHARGIEGIECFYPTHTKEQTKICLEYCKRNNMRITSGSDCHGTFIGDPYTIGAIKVEKEQLDLSGICK